jgi:hypothetical protein
LLQGNPQAAAQVQQASQPFNTLGDYLTAQNTAVQNAISAGQTGAAQTAADAQNAINTALGNVNTTVQNQYQTALSSAQAQQQAVQQALANLYGGQAAQTAPTTITGYGGSQNPWYNTTNYTVGNLSPDVLQSLGMTQDQWNTLQSAMQQAGTSQYMTGHNFGAASPTSQIDLTQYLNMQNPNAAITPGTVATPQEYAQMSAIQQLLGGSLPQNAVINPAMANVASTAPQTGINFNYQNALNAAQQVAQQERQAAQQEATGLTSAADLAHAQSQHQGGFGGFLSNIVSHPLNNPITQFFENPLTSVGSLTNPSGTTNAVNNLNNLLAKYGPAAIGTNI